jgi:hypothetical protein
MTTMTTIEIDISEIPHGHGLSFKKGIADGLLGNRSYETEIDATHHASYERGHIVGTNLKEKIAPIVKK